MMPERHATVVVDVQNASTVKSVPEEHSIHSWVESAISSSGDTAVAGREGDGAKGLSLSELVGQALEAFLHPGRGRG